jgi:arsenate reductase
VNQRRPEVLFLCVHNAGRSQIAAALLTLRSNGRIGAFSAGSEPAESLNPAVVAALAEWDIDISSEQPKKVDDETVRAVDVVVTMGCGDSCTVYPSKRYLDWEVPDPAGRPVEEVRAIRDEIDRRVRELVDQLVTSA